MSGLSRYNRELRRQLDPSADAGTAARQLPAATLHSPAAAPAIEQSATHAVRAPAGAPASRCSFDALVAAFVRGVADPARLRSIDEHLVACPPCLQRMMGLLDAREGSSLAMSDDAWEDVSTLPPGAWIGDRYRILNLLGRGGMGEVYEAFDVLLQETIALKTLVVTHCDSQRDVRRLLAEARLGRRVCHPNVCRTYDAGMHHDAARGERLAFLTMERLSGQTLRRLLQLRGPLPPAEARTMGQDILQGLVALHEAGIVHRDVKVDNVMVGNVPIGNGVGGNVMAAAAPGARRRTVLIDLGLAVDLAHAPPSQRRRATHCLEGTLAYMAPEQRSGQPATPATDVYGFGTTLLEMLTGQAPSPPSSAKRQAAPPAVGALSSRGLDLPAVEAFLEICGSLDPEARFPDARAALEMFKKIW